MAQNSRRQFDELVITVRSDAVTIRKADDTAMGLGEGNYPDLAPAVVGYLYCGGTMVNVPELEDDHPYHCFA